MESNINETPKDTSTINSDSCGVLLMPARAVDPEKQRGENRCDEE